MIERGSGVDDHGSGRLHVRGVDHVVDPVPDPVVFGGEAWSLSGFSTVDEPGVE